MGNYWTYRAIPTLALGPAFTILNANLFGSEDMRLQNAMDSPNQQVLRQARINRTKFTVIASVAGEYQASNTQCWVPVFIAGHAANAEPIRLMCWFSEGSHFSQALERIADNRITRPIMFVGMVDVKPGSRDACIRPFEQSAPAFAPRNHSAQQAQSRAIQRLSAQLPAHVVNNTRVHADLHFRMDLPKSIYRSYVCKDPECRCQADNGVHPSGIIPPPHEAPDEVVQCLKCKGDMADTLFLQADATNLRTGAEFEVNMMASMARVLVSNPLPTAEYYSVLINIVNQADGGIGAAEAMTDATQQLSLKYTAGIKLNDLNEVMAVYMPPLDNKPAVFATLHYVYTMEAARTDYIAASVADNANVLGGGGPTAGGAYAAGSDANGGATAVPTAAAAAQPQAAISANGAAAALADGAPGMVAAAAPVAPAVGAAAAVARGAAAGGVAPQITSNDVELLSGGNSSELADSGASE
eukprot:XP_001691799.1 predicted protein [Chlamydomonas reinhardtii]